MHNLVPHCILEQFSLGNRKGSFQAIGLFADISGFTPITDALMSHGQHGAEVLVTVMRTVFEPLIRSVYEQGGFVATLAGDAFTALFPLEMDSPSGTEARKETYQRALATGRAIQQSMDTNAIQATPYGVFSVSVKVGLAIGDVGWGIVAADDNERATYYFQGTAVDGCAEAEHLASAGEIVVSAELYGQLKEQVTVKPVSDHYRLVGVNTPLPSPLTVELPKSDPDLMLQFFPRDVVQQSRHGEFRQVACLFISLPTVRTETQLSIFMQSLFALQSHYGGLLNRLDFGDKGSYILLFWGAPVAYENDIERALNLILELQTRTSIPISAGITYHIAHAGFFGSPLIEEYTCYGRGTNLAARFMAAAPRGEIWMDERTAQRAKALFEIDFEEEIAFKGFAEAQKVYVLLERKEERESFYRSNTIGRQREIDALTDSVAPLWQGQYAGATIIRGEAGIGKSQLAHALQRSLRAERTDFLWAICQTDETLRESLNPFRYWLRHYFGVSKSQIEARNKRSFNRRLDALIAATRDPVVAGELDRTRSFLAALVALHWPDSLYEQIEDPQVRYENTLAGLIALLQAESLQQPVIILLEDAHWLDEDTRLFLPRLGRAMLTNDNRSYPLAIIATSRPEGPSLLLGEGMASREIDLGGLSHTGLAQLAEELLQAPAASPLVDLLTERAEGNPFFVEQILRYMQERDMLERGDDGWIPNVHNVAPLPADVRTVLVARLDRLTHEVKEVIQTAAVLGREFEIQLLAQMLRADARLPTKVAEAEQAAIWSALTELRYLFTHALLQDAAYRMQVRSRRQALHRLAAEALETLYAEDLTPRYGELGYHAEKAGLPGKAADWYLLAAERAKANGVIVEARAYYDRAMAVIPDEDVPRRWKALVGRISVLTILGETETTLSDVTTAFELATEMDDGSMIAEAYYLKANHAYSIGDDRGALSACDTALEAARQSGNLRIEALALGMKITSHGHLGEMAAAAAAAAAALLKAGALDDERVLVRNLNNAANYFMSAGDYGRAAELLLQHAAIDRRIGEPYGEAMGLLNLAVNYLHLGLYDSARDAAGQSLELTETLGARQLSAYNRMHLCLAHARLGEFTAAERLMEEAGPILDQVGDTFGQAVWCSYLGIVLEAAEQADAADSAFHEAREKLNEIGAVVYAIDALAGLCRCALTKEDFRQAKQYTSELWDYLIRHGAGGLEFPILAYQTCAQVFQSLGDTTKALAAIKAGHDELNTRAEKISELEWRRSFLENVAEHRMIVELSESTSGWEQSEEEVRANVVTEHKRSN